MTNVNCPDCNADQWDDLQQIKSTPILTSDEKRPLTLSTPHLKACSCPLITWDFYCSTEHYTHLECCNIEGKSEIQNPRLYIANFYFLPDPSFSNAHSITFTACPNGFIALNDPHSTDLLYTSSKKLFLQSPGILPSTTIRVHSADNQPTPEIFYYPLSLRCLVCQQMMHGLGMGRKTRGGGQSDNPASPGKKLVVKTVRARVYREMVRDGAFWYKTYCQWVSSSSSSSSYLYHGYQTGTNPLNWAP